MARIDVSWLVGIALELAGLDDIGVACFVIEPDPFKATELIDKRISAKRTALGLSA